MKVEETSNIYKEGSLEDLPLERPRVLHSSDLLPGIVRQRHLNEGLILFRGLIADRPSDGSTQKHFYYAEDESKLYVWNRVNEAWEVVALA